MSYRRRRDAEQLKRALLATVALIVAAVAMPAVVVGAGNGIFRDGFESGSVSRWSVPACSVSICSDASATCGQLNDELGGTCSCGDCFPPQFCGGGGVPNQCGGNCTPTSCEAAGYQCGDYEDSCGNIHFCGSCETGQTCAGIPSRCFLP